MKVVLGMSGGVDSSVAALLLQQQGCTVCGVTMIMTGGDNSDDIESAKNVCARLGITHTVLDMRRSFRANVKDRFASDYINGITPNPCAICNRTVKLKGLLDFAKDNSCDMISTGHYARITDDDGEFHIRKASDPTKDQTYMLCMIDKSMLPGLLFPLGDKTKKEIRAIAAKNGFSCASKPDSQDICFIKDGDYAAFIERETDFRSARGNFIDTSCGIIGTHSGHIHFTTGQRKGLGMGFAKRMYVLGKDTVTNEVMLGDERELYSSGLTAKNVNLLTARYGDHFRALVKTRYSQTETPADIYINEGLLTASFDRPVRAVTAGQPVALYDGDILIGGAEITSDGSH